MSRRLVTVIVSDVPAIIVLYIIFLIVAVQLLDIETSSSLVVAQISIRGWFKWVVTSGSSLGMKVFSQVNSLFVVSSLSSVHVVNVVCLLKAIGSILLVLENLCENPFLDIWIYVGSSSTLEWHSSTMDSVELSFDINSSWRPLTSWIWVSCYGRSNCLKLWWTRNQILSLITAWLDHEALRISFSSWINRLPCILHSDMCISNTIVLGVSFPSSVLLLAHKSDR